MSVRVRFDVREPERHLVHVTQRFPATPEGERTFRMAAWVPGSYKIRDFGRHVQDLTATVGGRKRAVRQTGKDAWMVTGTKDQEVELTFAVYGRELGVRSTHVTSDHAHLFPATLALYDEASRAQPHEVSCAAPRGWRLWSALHGSDDEGAAPATVGTAADYDELIDSPLELAPPSEVHVVSFTARRKRHRLVFYHPPGGVDWTRLTKDVRGVVEAAARLFGGLPYDHYTFITHVAAGHGGGLEHRASTVLGLDPAGLLTDYEKRFLPLVAHEFFHVWNVKRIQPSAFQPFDLQREVHTDLLWLFEGFTAYHEPVLLRRAGVIDDARFGELVAESLGFYEMALGRKRRSAAEASRLAWTLLYQPHEHNINRNVSYYGKGQFIALCLEAHLRRNGATEGLDAVMRHLWKHHGDAGAGVPEGSAAVAAIVQEATGVDCRRELARWVDGTGELPIAAALRDLGWDLKRDHSDPKNKLALGVHFKAGGDDGRPVIERIPEDVPAAAVLQPDDELVAVEGYAWSKARLQQAASTREAGDTVRLAVFREGRLRELDVPLWEKPPDKLTITPRKGDAVATRRRNAWLATGS